jgi:tRNA A-37 threonylcarbamoyl transferase component Bud32
LSDFRDQVQDSLGAAYIVRSELGGGGMSRVFLADEVRFNRQVVVKLLSPELAAGINAERFEREITLAASLQQANIVPVLSAGEANGLPYFTMPYVEGESLRHRLGQSPPLGITDLVRILGDVARALQYAHARGIVHRDIKPDNVLLSGGTAVVTDFGIAKALSASRTSAGTDESLTQLGTSIGTPAYMAPEQAAGDPDVDHRADIYAFGCMAYELLTGHSPFHGRTPQRILAAHMSENPAPIDESRPDAPLAMRTLITRCLAKDPIARPQTAADLVAALDAVTSGGDHPMPPPRITQAPVAFRRAIVVYLVAAMAEVAVATLATNAIGLPDWVPTVAVGLAILALPVLLFAGYAQSVKGRALSATPTMATLALRASPYLSWRNTSRWGTYALGAFALIVVGSMLARVAGVGPFATLLSAGTLTKNQTVLVSEFAFANSSDTTLGRVIADAVKTDLSQSKAVTLLGDGEIASTLVEMRRPGARLLLPVAQEVAQRRGVKAIVDGSLNPLGNGFVVKLRLVSADSARELASMTGAADSPSQLIDVVGTLTRRLRAKMGESLKSVRESPPLHQATTSSLAALRKFSDARYALNHGDRTLFIRLMGDAVAIDSTFATAYLSLGVEYANIGRRDAEVARLVTRAYMLRHRLPDAERLFVESYYYRFGPPSVRDPVAAAVRIDSIIKQFPNYQRAYAAVTTAGIDAWNRGDLARAESLFRISSSLDTTTMTALNDLVRSQFVQGKRAAADSSLRVLERRFGARGLNNHVEEFRIDTGDVAGSESRLKATLAGAQDPFVRERVITLLVSLMGERGRLREHAEWLTRYARLLEDRGVRSASLIAAAQQAEARVMTTGDTSAAIKVLDASLHGGRLDSIVLLDRPYYELANAYALAGRPDRAAQYLAGVKQQVVEGDPATAYETAVPMAEILMDQGKGMEAASVLQRGATGWKGNGIAERRLAMAYDRAGQRDSALVAYERALSRIGGVGVEQPIMNRRAGELYAEKGDLARAIAHYRKFVDAWKNADAELQPQVNDVRQRIARLEQQERRGR